LLIYWYCPVVEHERGTERMADHLTIPADVDAITAAWMTAALSASHPEAEVSGVEVLLRDDGTNRRSRLRLTYSRGAGPETVFVKAGDRSTSATSSRAPSPSTTGAPARPS
jgi:hypothetical protein